MLCEILLTLKAIVLTPLKNIHVCILRLTSNMFAKQRVNLIDHISMYIVVMSPHTDITLKSLTSV